MAVLAAFSALQPRPHCKSDHPQLERWQRSTRYGLVALFWSWRAKCSGLEQLRHGDDFTIQKNKNSNFFFSSFPFWAEMGSSSFPKGTAEAIAAGAHAVLVAEVGEDVQITLDIQHDPQALVCHQIPLE